MSKNYKYGYIPGIGLVFGAGIGMIFSLLTPISFYIGMGAGAGIGLVIGAIIWSFNSK